MTNPSTHAPHAQTQNTSSQYLAIDFSHRRPRCASKTNHSFFMDSIDHFAYRAIGVLEVMQQADMNIYAVLGTAISEIEDIRETAIAYAKHIESQEAAVNLAEHLNTNPQT